MRSMEQWDSVFKAERHGYLKRIQSSCLVGQRQVSERQGASRRYITTEPAASALPLTIAKNTVNKNVSSVSWRCLISNDR